MSVIVYGPDAWGKIGDFFLKDRDARDVFFESHEMEYSKVIDTSTFYEMSGDEWLDMKVKEFFCRLYLANQRAGKATYTDMRADPEEYLEDIDFKGGLNVTRDGALHSLLRMQYNLVSNGGNTFLGSKDQARLDSIMYWYLKEYFFEKYNGLHPIV
jgi:hypothetical protein